MKFIQIITLFFFFITSCTNLNNSSPVPPPKPSPNPPGTFAKGADIGWLQQMEATGYVFYNDAGAPEDCLKILKDHGIESIRLRVWVNPSNHKVNGHNSPDEVVIMAARAASMGFRIMIDFHYSDTWADPGQQIKPASWEGHSLSQLQSDVYTHTFDVMTALKSKGVVPEWVQVGNEINPGMILPEGAISGGFANIAQLINSGYDAVKAVSPNTKVVIHLANGQNNNTFQTFFDGLQANGGKWDVIGLSYYPYWVGTDYTVTINALTANLNDMVLRYGKDVIVSEIGGDYTLVQNTYDTVLAVLNKVGTVSGGRGLGVFYWEPQGAHSWSGYRLGAWGDNGRPTAALDAFLATPLRRVTGLTPPGATVVLYSNNLMKYLTVNPLDANRLTATAATISGNTEKFLTVKNPDNSISFQSLANSKFLSATNTSDALIADADSVGNNQKFTIIERLDGGQAILSNALSTHWNTNTDNKIHSEWADEVGGWQSFTVGEM